MNSKEIQILKKISLLCEQLITASAEDAVSSTESKPGGSKRHRLTQAELAALPQVLDSTGTPLEPGMKVKCSDGWRGKIVRVDRRSRRAVYERNDGESGMVTASKLTITSGKRALTAA